VFLQALEVTLNRVTDVRHGFLAGLALRNAARQRGTFGHKHTIFVRLDEDSEFHAHTIATRLLIGNEGTGASAV